MFEEGEGELIDAMAEVAEAMADLIEAKRGLQHDRHQAHLAPAETAVQQVMAGYFIRQQDALLTEVLPHLRSNIAQFTEARFGFSTTLKDDHGVFLLAEAEVRKNGKRFADSLVPSSLSPLTFSITSGEDSAYNEAISNAIAGAAKVLQAEMATDANPHPNVASNYLHNNSLSKLTGEIAETSKARLRNAIADAWDEGGSFDQIVGAIKDTFANFSDVRAGMIAQTEVVDAYNAGREATARAAGLAEKSWETESGNPCPTCVGNEDEGWIGIDDSFSSGDDSPTAHPNCECVLNFRSVADAADEG